MTNRIEEVQVGKDLHDSVKVSMFSHHVNRSSLAVRVSQSELFAADYLVQHLCGSIYAHLLFSLDKSDDNLKKSDELIQKGLDDIHKLATLFYKTDKENEE